MKVSLSCAVVQPGTEVAVYTGIPWPAVPGQAEAWVICEEGAVWGGCFRPEVRNEPRLATPPWPGLRPGRPRIVQPGRRPYHDARISRISGVK